MFVHVQWPMWTKSTPTHRTCPESPTELKEESNYWCSRLPHTNLSFSESLDCISASRMREVHSTLLLHCDIVLQTTTTWNDLGSLYLDYTIHSTHYFSLIHLCVMCTFVCVRGGGGIGFQLNGPENAYVRCLIVSYPPPPPSTATQYIVLKGRNGIYQHTTRGHEETLDSEVAILPLETISKGFPDGLTVACVLSSWNPASLVQTLGGWSVDNNLAPSPFPASQMKPYTSYHLQRDWCHWRAPHQSSTSRTAWSPQWWSLWEHYLPSPLLPSLYTKKHGPLIYTRSLCHQRPRFSHTDQIITGQYY